MHSSYDSISSFVNCGTVCTSGQLRHPLYRFRGGLCFVGQLTSCIHVVTDSGNVHLVRSTDEEVQTGRGGKGREPTPCVVLFSGQGPRAPPCRRRVSLRLQKTPRTSSTTPSSVRLELGLRGSSFQAGSDVFHCAPCGKCHHTNFCHDTFVVGESPSGTETEREVVQGVDTVAESRAAAGHGGEGDGLVGPVCLEASRPQWLSSDGLTFWVCLLASWRERTFQCHNLAGQCVHEVLFFENKLPEHFAGSVLNWVHVLATHKTVVWSLSRSFGLSLLVCVSCHPWVENEHMKSSGIPFANSRRFCPVTAVRGGVAWRHPCQNKRPFADAHWGRSSCHRSGCNRRTRPMARTHLLAMTQWPNIALELASQLQQ